MRQIYYLSTCYTCKRIIAELSLHKKDFVFIDVKDKPLREHELAQIKEMSGASYEELFNKRAMKFKKDDFSSEEDYKKGILSEYTFMKRPIIIIDDKIFVGNSKSVVEAAKAQIASI
jgi:arsenate reductase